MLLHFNLCLSILSLRFCSLVLPSKGCVFSMSRVLQNRFHSHPMCLKYHKPAGILLMVIWISLIFFHLTHYVVGLIFFCNRKLKRQKISTANLKQKEGERIKILTDFQSLFICVSSSNWSPELSLQMLEHNNKEHRKAAYFPVRANKSCVLWRSVRPGLIKARGTC